MRVGNEVAAEMRCIAGIAVRSPTRRSHPAPSGGAYDAWGAVTTAASPTQSPLAHSVTRPTACSTTSSTRASPSSERTV